MGDCGSRVLWYSSRGRTHLQLQHRDSGSLRPQKTRLDIPMWSLDRRIVVEQVMISRSAVPWLRVRTCCMGSCKSKWKGRQKDAGKTATYLLSPSSPLLSLLRPSTKNMFFHVVQSSSPATHPRRLQSCEGPGLLLGVAHRGNSCPKEASDLAFTPPMHPTPTQGIELRRGAKVFTTWVIAVLVDCWRMNN